MMMMMLQPLLEYRIIGITMWRASEGTRWDDSAAKYSIEASAKIEGFPGIIFRQ